jgi:isoleucyl-tRNA synthetase
MVVATRSRHRSRVVSSRWHSPFLSAVNLSRLRRGPGQHNVACMCFASTTASAHREFANSRENGYNSQTLLMQLQPIGKKQGGGGRKKKEKNAYASTIILPETPFSQRANAVQREPELQEYWKSIDLYNKLSADAEKAGAERYVLHDGPPYANGDLHIGHALNKLLKDFINRHQVLQGKQVHYVPGWDCHGLPIELKVLQGMKSKERQGLTPIKLRERAAEFAKETVEKQSASFQRYGVFGDFDHPYLTLQPEFEAAQIEVFGEMFKAGYIFRGRKPVHWSPSSRTALAEAELEYPEGHVSKSIYVAFEVDTPSEKLVPYHGEKSDDRLKVAIWTTTTLTIRLFITRRPEDF